MSSDVVDPTATPTVAVEGLSKTYRVYDKPSDRLWEAIFPGRARHAAFEAVRDVSFTLGRGETLGIVGRNGSGKSTLLQMICGTLTPTGGTVKTRGRLAALLELGAGFNAEFTGRENVRLNAAILGMSPDEVDARFESIAEFAGLGEFLERPVKTYSSGMYVRLAFATAINSDPDILVVDEALAVGDEAFQRKCFARIEQIQARGATVIFVSHAPSSVLQLCTRALLMDAGEVLMDGHPKTVVANYQKLVNQSGTAAERTREAIREAGRAGRAGGAATDPADEAEERTAGKKRDTSLEAYDPHLVSKSRVDYDEQGARISNMRVLNAEGERVNRLLFGRTYTYAFDVAFSAPAERVGFGMLVKTRDGVELSGGTTSRSRELHLDRVEPGERRTVEFPFRCEFTPGIYFLNAGVTAEVDGEMVFLHRVIDGIPFHVTPEPDIYATGMVNVLTGKPRTGPQKGEV